MNNKRYFNNTYNSEFKGVRSDIHRDINNHNSFVLYLKIENNELSNIVADWFPGSAEFANAGDSIFKEYGKITIEIKKKNGDAKTFKLDW